MNKTTGKVSVGWFLYDLKTKKVLIHQRNDKRSGDSKGWDYFGGAGKKGETPEEAVRRELCEELCISPKKVNRFGKYRTKDMFYILPTREEKKHMRLREGAGMGWFTFNNALDCLEDLAPDARKKLKGLWDEVDPAGLSNLATRASRK